VPKTKVKGFAANSTIEGRALPPAPPGTPRQGRRGPPSTALAMLPHPPPPRPTDALEAGYEQTLDAIVPQDPVPFVVTPPRTPTLGSPRPTRTFVRTRAFPSSQVGHRRTSCPLMPAMLPPVSMQLAANPPSRQSLTASSRPATRSARRGRRSARITSRR
jgi:hypothetical protein